jgi:hypothetical protein
MTNEKGDLLKEVMSEAVLWFNAMLAVEAVQATLRLDGRMTCGRDGGVSFPQR